MRGTVRLEPVPMFRSCDFEVNARFEDSTSLVIGTYRVLGANEEEGLYLLARGAFSPTREVILRELEFAAVPSDADGCQQPAPAYFVQARGVLPAWRVTVTDAGMEFDDPESGSLRFQPASPRDSANAVVYEASSVDGEPHTLRLTLQRMACNEGNHVFAAMRAEVLLDGRALSGCAWRGKIP